MDDTDFKESGCAVRADEHGEIVKHEQADWIAVGVENVVVVDAVLTCASRITGSTSSTYLDALDFLKHSITAPTELRATCFGSSERRGAPAREQRGLLPLRQSCDKCLAASQPTVETDEVPSSEGTLQSYGWSRAHVDVGSAHRGPTLRAPVWFRDHEDALERERRAPRAGRVGGA